MYDVYMRINNTHIRAWHGLRLVTVSDSELLLRSRHAKRNCPGLSL